MIEEGGVKMKLTVIDTPGFGDQINNENWYLPAPEIYLCSARKARYRLSPIENDQHPPWARSLVPRELLLLTIHGKPSVEAELAIGLRKEGGEGIAPRLCPRGMLEFCPLDGSHLS